MIRPIALKINPSFKGKAKLDKKEIKSEITKCTPIKEQGGEIGARYALNQGIKEVIKAIEELPNNSKYYITMRAHNNPIKVYYGKTLAQTLPNYDCELIVKKSDTNDEFTGYANIYDGSADEDEFETGYARNGIIKRNLFDKVIKAMEENALGLQEKNEDDSEDED